MQYPMLVVAGGKTGKSLVHGLAMSTVSHLAWAMGCQSDLQTGADVPAFDSFHLHPSIAATLEQLGWSPDDPFLREATPTVARGHNLLAVTPPAPAYATPALAGVLSQLENGRRAVLIVPPAQLEVWAALVHALVHHTNLRVLVARGVARAMRQLRAGALDVLVTTPDTTLTLVTRSVLRMNTVDTFMLAWPELLLDEDSITPLMQDLRKEAQRVIYTAEPESVGALMERYARKALTVGRAGAEGVPSGPVRTVSTSWAGRIGAVADLVELVDPASLVVWTVDRSQHDAIGQILDVTQPGVHLVTGDAPATGTIIAFDLPTGERLRQLVTAGDVIILVPPGCEAYLSRIAAPRRPWQLPGLIDAARAWESAQRAAIIKTIEAGHTGRALLTLAPLFERYDAAAVSAALFELWTGSAHPTPPAPETAATAKVFVGVGKKDGATANDLVAALTKELRVERTKIGRIELRDAYSLIELPAQEVEQLAARLNGLTIRRKRVTARVDRGPKGPPRSRV